VKVQKPPSQIESRKQINITGVTKSSSLYFPIGLLTATLPLHQACTRLTFANLLPSGNNHLLSLLSHRVRQLQTLTFRILFHQAAPDSLFSHPVAPRNSRLFIFTSHRAKLLRAVVFAIPSHQVFRALSAIIPSHQVTECCLRSLSHHFRNPWHSIHSSPELQPLKISPFRPISCSIHNKPNRHFILG